MNKLVDTVAKGGNFMLGIGPSSLGSFHPVAVQQVKQAGEWLRINGEGIYATRPRPGLLWSEGADLRFTRSKDDTVVYCFALHWPGKSLVIRSLPNRTFKQAHLLGYPHELAMRSGDNKSLIIDIPEGLQSSSNRPCDYVWCFRLT